MLWTLSTKVLTEPVSEMPAPDKLSARRRSLSGSCPLDDSALFFSIDLERLWCSYPAAESIESCDWDRFSVLAKIQSTNSRNRISSHWQYSHVPLVLGTLFCMPNRCWLINFVADARLLLGMKEALRFFFDDEGNVADAPLLLLQAAIGSVRLSSDAFLGGVPLSVDLPFSMLKLPAWNRVLRCFGNCISFASMLDSCITAAESSDWNDAWPLLGITPRLCIRPSPDALRFTRADDASSQLLFSASNGFDAKLSISRSSRSHEIPANSSPAEGNRCVWQLAYVSELSTLAKSALLLLL